MPRVTLDRRQRVALIGIVLLLGTGAELRADETIYRKVIQATPWVLSPIDEKRQSMGSGVLVHAGRRLVLTSWHVVEDRPSAVVFFPALTRPDDQCSPRYYLSRIKTLGIRGRVIATDKKRDLAVIQLQRIPRMTHALPLALRSALPGQMLYAVGNSGSTAGALWRYRDGKVRQVYRRSFKIMKGKQVVDCRVVEAQLPTNSGDSGGPMVNAAGELVAITCAKSNVETLVDYGIDISEIRRMRVQGQRLGDLVPRPRRPRPIVKRPKPRSRAPKATAPTANSRKRATLPAPRTKIGWFPPPFSAPSTTWSPPARPHRYGVWTRPAPAVPRRAWTPPSRNQRSWDAGRSPGFGAPGARIVAVRQTHDVRRHGQRGVELAIDADVDGQRGVPLQIAVVVCDVGRRAYFARTNQRVPGGALGAITRCVPRHDGARLRDWRVFLPYRDVDQAVPSRVSLFNLAVDVWSEGTRSWICPKAHWTTMSRRAGVQRPTEPRPLRR